MAWTTPGTATAGEVLTAAFWNTNVRDNSLALPRGVVGYATSTATTAVTTVETIAMTASTFTAEAGRRYLVTYMEPGIGPAGAVGGVNITLRIRLTNVSGTILSYGNFGSVGGGNNTTATASGLITLSAGSTTIVATATLSTGTANRGGGLTAYLLIEDVGLA